MSRFSIRTRASEEFCEITSEVQRLVTESRRRDGVCVVSCPHTTAGVTINECADPAVATDLCAALDAMIPLVPWEHAEGNSAAHVKTMLVGSECVVGIEDGALSLGRWQGIFLCEFDGPRTREVRVWFVS
jgi:secondary thiamine-phosphate synthase enzyme